MHSLYTDLQHDRSNIVRCRDVGNWLTESFRVFFWILFRTSLKCVTLLVLDKVDRNSKRVVSTVCWVVLVMREDLVSVMCLFGAIGICVHMFVSVWLSVYFLTF